MGDSNRHRGGLAVTKGGTAADDAHCCTMVSLCCVALLATCGLGMAHTKYVSNSTTSPEPAEDSAAVMASHVVQELLSQQEKLPVIFKELPSNHLKHYGLNEDKYAQYEHQFITTEDDAAPAPSSSEVTPSGFHVKGVLGLVEYLILLILLKGSINHIAERSAAYRKSRRRRAAEPGDLLGHAEELTDDLMTPVLGELMTPELGASHTLDDQLRRTRRVDKKSRQHRGRGE